MVKHAALKERKEGMCCACQNVSIASILIWLWCHGCSVMNGEGCAEHFQTRLGLQMVLHHLYPGASQISTHAKDAPHELGISQISVATAHELWRTL